MIAIRNWKLILHCIYIYSTSVNIILVFPMIGSAASPPTPTGDYGVSLENLVSLTRDQKFSSLQQYGGVSQIWFIWLYHIYPSSSSLADVRNYNLTLPG